MIEKKNMFVYSFYRFVEIKNRNIIKLQFLNFLKKTTIKGTILIANEGINASLSGNESELNHLITLVKKILNIRKLQIKVNKTNSHSFNKLKVRIKNEIVSLGVGLLEINKLTGKYISPKKWDKFISQKNVKLIDTRNIYEIDIGKFKNSINPKTKNFREFPKKFKELNLPKSQEIAMYCTGGIRCEKASSYLKKKGYKNIHQLDGGIINYLDFKNNSGKSLQWTGECFVFDNRVTVDQDLNKGRYEQCYGCRHPITKNDMESKNYKKGVYCPLCINERTAEQKKSSEDRQKQINKHFDKIKKY
tara:strand:+ start:1499 stop:2410 length:912 start_codon:yes stop_codon:yes gene_type:complete